MSILSPELDETTSVLGIKTAISILSAERKKRTKTARTFPTVADKRRQEAIVATLAGIEDMLTDTLPGRPS